MNRGDIKLIIDRCIAHDVPDAADLIESLRQQLADARNESAAFAQLADQRYDETKEFQKQLADSQKQVLMLRDALKEIHEDFDCDSDAHRYGTTCRCCLAKEALTATEPKP